MLVGGGHGGSSSRLYRILDDNRVPRRKASKPKIPLYVQREIVAEYAGDAPIASIAARHAVATSTGVRRGEALLATPPTGCATGTNSSS